MDRFNSFFEIIFCGCIVSRVETCDIVSVVVNAPTDDDPLSFFLLAIMCFQQSRHLTNGLEFHDPSGRCLNGWNCLPQSMHDAFLVPLPVGGCTDGGFFLYDESADNTFVDGVAFLPFPCFQQKL